MGDAAFPGEHWRCREAGGAERSAALKSSCLAAPHPSLEEHGEEEESTRSRSGKGLQWLRGDGDAGGERWGGLG